MNLDFRTDIDSCIIAVTKILTGDGGRETKTKTSCMLRVFIQVLIQCASDIVKNKLFYSFNLFCFIINTFRV